MAKPFEATIPYEQRVITARNFVDRLQLLPGSQVLIVSAQLSKDPDLQMVLQRNMASELRDQVFKVGSKAMNFEFDPDWQKDLLEEKTAVALGQLDALDNFRYDKNLKLADRPTTVVYLGDGSKIPAIYKAIGEVGRSKGKKINFTVTHELTEEHMKKIDEANEFFDQFLEKHPRGIFQVVSRGEDGQERVLDFGYDISKNPITRDSDNFGGLSESSLSEYVNIVSLNVPREEKLIRQDYFRKAHGEFSAQGLIFKVADGMLIKIRRDEGTKIEDLNSSQRQFIDALNGRLFPLVKELNLGLYQLAGIKTDSGPAFTQSGPHINFTLEYQKPSGSKEKLTTGFVLDNPFIMQDSRLQFYPPPATV